mmetsp:Transcript_128512/g.371881  ORF Transcript_128512/g.371881 Transcript_128512/m.371881 type:complete len:371 (-) Transcript_128512:148-1260(-)|eukprot:CAMPEP_0176033290 /NCGR_PEP_ID=MMETSP0120_2-20121206/16441_1 /TAXON_ID=160619 /ORGANISM="Kryptoperidinium foliaceum, Strain CCMP 1326" /LENGTH=370 /DNA_ID=CAMNT_0017366615 /DNA_START=73 /DNA_END=1185 /DNA_ORIENTATION=+
MSSGVQVIITPEEFQEDLEMRLGRANGNVYHRREGIEGVHDGQVMVRLKKKRFIIVDYSIVPTEQDMQVAAAQPHISIPNGAGKAKCATPECTKVGVPVLLYDSEPSEPTSLYMRSGLCFTCQRNLNEKRRTQRKRPADGVTDSSVVYAVGPGQKKFKLNGSTVELHSDAIILNAPPEGTKSVRAGYSFDDIAPDLSASVQEASHDTHRLIHAITGNTNSTSAPAPNGLSVEEAANAAVEATTGMMNGGSGAGGTESSTGQDGTATASTSEDINALYDKTFNALSRSIYLLTQWKQSWDAAIAAAVAQETVGDPSLADAVASAAAVVAAAADGGQDNNNMVSLLLAADQRKESGKNGGGGESSNVEAFEV